MCDECISSGRPQSCPGGGVDARASACEVHLIDDLVEGAAEGGMQLLPITIPTGVLTAAVLLEMMKPSKTTTLHFCLCVSSR